MKKLLLFVLLAGCSGRCNNLDALSDEVPGGLCFSTQGTQPGLCLRRDLLYSCSSVGIWFKTATCVVTGRVIPAAEAP